jgi:hypothetical protein
MSTKIPQRFAIEHELRQQYGQWIGWMGNVINCHHSNPTKKIKGLRQLAAENRVAPASGSMDLILIDGAAVGWSELEKYA